MKHNVDIVELERLYSADGLTTRQISEVLNIPHRTINRYLNAAGVKMRKAGMPIISKLRNKDWLYSEYVDLHKSTTEIAKKIGCSNHSISYWLNRHNINARSTGSEKGHIRTTAEVREKLSKAKRGKYLGENNPNWRGGRPFVDPDRGRYKSKMWVKAIKDRDGWKCVECGDKQNLHSHHIKRWKDHPDIRYDLDNGITLCHSCHEAAHGRGFKFRWTSYKQKDPRAHRSRQA